jgi:hypothetical protein
MNKKLVNILSTVFIILVIGAILFFVTRGNPTGAVVSDSVAKYIGAHSVVYVQTGCSACQAQEAEFGSSWKYINSIDCIANKTNLQACTIANIKVTPTWVINGKQYLGVQTIATLENLTGYK